MRRRVIRSTLTAILVCSAALAGACVNGRPVLVPEDSPMKIGPNVTGRMYLMAEGQWTLSDKKIHIPEGWYVVPPSFADEPAQNGD